MAGRRIVVEFLGRDTSLSKTASQVENKTSRMGAGLKKVGRAAGLGLAAGGVAALGFGKQVIDSASAAQQSLGATETVFGKFAETVKMYSEGAANSVGLSANAYRENANLIGSLFKNQGVAADELAGKTHDMIKVGADLAATFGGTTKESVEALGSAFKGEYDPLERYGISLKESTVNAELAKRGQDKLTGAALRQAKQMAITDLITKQSKDSIGAFSRESDTLAGAQQRLGAKFENLKASLGEKLLPVATKVVTWASDLTGKFLSGDTAANAFKKTFELVGNVIRPIGEWIGNDLVPFIKDLAQRFRDAMGGTDGFKQSMRDLKPFIDVVKRVLGVLWDGFKWAAKQILPIVVKNLRVLAQVLGAVGRFAIWLWNGAFAPTIRFILRGFGWVLDKIGDFLVALGRIPGFEWADRAGRKMQAAARKAADLAKNIEDIPNKKEVEIKVRYTGNSGIGGADAGGYALTGAGSFGGRPRNRRAGGSRIEANRVYSWNENGREMFMSNTAGDMETAAETRRAGRGGGDVHVHIHGVMDKQAAAREVRKVLLDLKRTVGPLGLA